MSLNEFWVYTRLQTLVVCAETEQNSLLLVVPAILEWMHMNRRAVMLPPALFSAIVDDHGRSSYAFITVTHISSTKQDIELVYKKKLRRLWLLFEKRKVD